MVGALPFIDEIKDKVLVSIAHTNADYHTASQAFAHGAKQVTHLYNAMPPFSHREPGVIGAAFDAKDTMVEIICDGVHIHPSVVRATLQLFGTDRVIFVSDSMRATGLQDGSYTLGGQPVFVKDKRATLSDGTIAGSVTNLMDCVRNAVFHMGIPLEAALTCSCANPAKAIGAFEHYGSLSVGKYCNVVLLEQDSLNVRGVYIRGKEFTRISSSTYTSCK